MSIAFTVAQAELVCHKVSVPVFSSWVYQGHLSLTNIFLLLFFTLTQDLKHPWINFIVDASCDVVCYWRALTFLYVDVGGGVFSWMLCLSRHPVKRKHPRVSSRILKW